MPIAASTWRCGFAVRNGGRTNSALSHVERPEVQCLAWHDNLNLRFGEVTAPANISGARRADELGAGQTRDDAGVHGVIEMRVRHEHRV